jgi:hypothetical protein
MKPYSIKLVQKAARQNEARAVQDITRLIVPSAETLATFGAKHLEVLVRLSTLLFGRKIITHHF